MSGTIPKLIFPAAFFAAMGLLSGCGSSSSSGIYNQAFNLSGQWSGQIGDGGTSRNLSLTLNDTAGSITGTMIVTDHSCFDGWNLTGTATQAAANTTGDNSLTTDQENSNDGTVDLVMARTETVGDDEVTRTINFNLTGNSTSLTGQYSGTWIGAKLATCRNGILGDISITKN